MESLFEKGIVMSFEDEKLHCRLYRVSDIVEYFIECHDKVKIKDYIKKMRLRDVSLAADWKRLVYLRPVDTPGGKQNVKFMNTEGVCRLILAFPASRAVKMRAKIALEASKGFDKWLSSEEAKNSSHYIVEK